MKKLIAASIILIANFIYPQSDVEILAEWMSGSFSNEEQASIDSSYYSIELEMVQIWKDRQDGPWIYVEQAFAEFKAEPYRQMIYQLRKSVDSNIESIVYTISNPKRFAGAYKKDIPLLRLTPDSLVLREGCKVVLYREDAGHFVGGTEGNNCKGNWQTSSYTTFKVKIKEDKIISWDRGFNAEDEQVWGAKKGGYIFLKRKTGSLMKISH